MTVSSASVRRINNLDKVVCPVCGGENASDAVFCANERCRKSLGDFKYIREELVAAAKWHEVIAERATSFIGKPHFLVVHLLWFAAWVLINTGVFAMVRRFDDYPFALLGIILTAEAIFISGFILISQNRQNLYASKQSELDYEVSVRTYRELAELDVKLDAILERLSAMESRQD